MYGKRARMRENEELESPREEGAFIHETETETSRKKTMNRQKNDAN